MLYDEINLTRAEKQSLFSFRFRKKKEEKDIKCYYDLYFKRKFIKQNYTGEITDMGEEVFDGTYSLSKFFFEYKESRRKWILIHLPNWLALIISFISLAMSLFNFLVSIGLIELAK